MYLINKTKTKNETFTNRINLFNPRPDHKFKYIMIISINITCDKISAFELVHYGPLSSNSKLPFPFSRSQICQFVQTMNASIQSETNVLI